MMSRQLLLIFLTCIAFQANAFGQGKNVFKNIDDVNRFFVKNIMFSDSMIDNCYSGYVLFKFEITKTGNLKNVQVVFEENKILSESVKSALKLTDLKWTLIGAGKTVFLPVYFVNYNKCNNSEKIESNSDVREKVGNYRNWVTRNIIVMQCIIVTITSRISRV